MMGMYPRRIDRVVSFAVYVCFGGMTLWAGSALINHAVESNFYEDFLLGWEKALMIGNEEGLSWPHFTGSNHAAYMDQLVKAMRATDIAPPRSNKERAFQYGLDLLGYPEENIFLLALPRQMILYGISSRTFSYLDRKIDGQVDWVRGRFTGERSKDGFTFIGQWRL
jgi:hypothetical protein